VRIRLLIFPLSLTMQVLGLLNSYWSLIITCMTITLPLRPAGDADTAGGVRNGSNEIGEATEVGGCPA
jgi:hypothetical protein